VFLGSLSTQIADGGFGPGKGLWSLETLVDEYETLRPWQWELADERLAAPLQKAPAQRVPNHTLRRSCRSSSR
jgi:hypothetical protein